MSDFGLFVSACKISASNTNTVKYLVSEGADVKHPVIAYIAKIYACEKVREYLLTQIDDNSEDYWCEELEDEIHEIRNTFFNRIRAGEFDGD
jgi:hypothetical protein